jgi:hypothetical protein
MHVLRTKDIVLHSLGARGGVLVEPLCYKPEGHGFVNEVFFFFF